MPGMSTLLALPDEDESSAVSSAASRGATRRATQRRAHLIRLVKGRALECLSVVGAAVGAERFNADAVAALRGIVGLLAASSRGRDGLTASSGDDPVLSFIWEAVRRIARTIGADRFSPFVDAIVPPLLVAARAETRVTTIHFGPKTDVDSAVNAAVGDVAAVDEDEDDDDDDYIHEDAGPSAVVRVKTAALEEKQSAILALGAVAGFVRGATHAHYSGAILSALLPCLELAGAPFDDIREAAGGSLCDCLVASASALSTADVLRAADDLLRAGRSSISPGTALNPSASAYIAMTSTALVALAKAAVADDSFEIIKSLVSCINAVLQESARRSNFADADVAESAGVPQFLSLIPLDVLSGLTQLLVQIRQASINRRAVRAAELVVNADDIDEEEAEAIKKKDDDEWTLQVVMLTLLRAHALFATSHSFFFRSCSNTLLKLSGLCCVRTAVHTCQCIRHLCIPSLSTCPTLMY